MPQPPWTHTSPSFDDEVEALLSGRAPGSPPSAELHRVAAVVAVLTAPATDDEMRGLDGALQAFHARLGMSRTVPTARRRRAAVLAGLAAGLVATGGAAAAAAAGSLPGPVQNFAHDVVGAPPAVHRTPPHRAAAATTAAAPATARSGPPATEAPRLCTAYLDARRHRDTAFSHSRAFGRLIAIAGGRDNVADFCATVASPSAGAPDAGSTHATGHGRPANPGASAHRPTAPHSRHPAEAPASRGHPAQPGKWNRPAVPPPGSGGNRGSSGR